ncbi:MAG: efflux RND transporter periplasmic adaptor subunit [Arenibacterium sp.]
MPDPAKPSLVRRVMTFLITLGFVAGAGYTVATGSNVLAQRSEAAPTPDAAPLTPVSVSLLAVEEGYLLTRRLIGQVEAGNEAVLSFERAGRLAVLNADEGEWVTAGAVLARQDTDQLETELTRLTASRKATEAQLTFAESRLKRVQDLRKTGFSSQQTLDEALAARDELQNRIAETDAAMASVQVQLDKSVLIAPFDGRIGAQTANLTETMSAGQPVVTLIETSNPVVRIGLPLAMEIDELIQTRVEIGGRSYAAKLRQVRPDIDPVTRTQTVLFDVEGDVSPAFGQTATLVVDMPVALRGSWVPLDALQEGSGSIWTILVVKDGIVRSAAVELLHTEAERAYVRGTFSDGARLINRGAHRVVPGQRVDIIEAGV